MDNIKNTILETAAAYPHILLIAVVILIIIIILMCVNPYQYFDKSKKHKKKNLDSDEEIDELIESINEKQKRCRKNQNGIQ